MPGKNKGGIGLFWVPRRKHHHHHNKSHENKNYNNDKKHSAFGNSNRKPQQIPMMTTEAKPEHMLTKPVLMKTDLPLDAIPSTSTSPNKSADPIEGSDTKTLELTDAIVSEHDDSSDIDDTDFADGNQKKKKNKKKGKDNKDDNSDMEPEQGCAFQCLAVTVECCGGCTIS